MRDRFFRASRVMTGCGMRCDRDGMGRVMEKRPITRPIYNPGTEGRAIRLLEMKVGPSKVARTSLQALMPYRKPYLRSQDLLHFRTYSVL